MNIVTVVVTPVARFIGELERRRTYRNTERLIGALPADIRKDIGWPGSAQGIEERHEPRA